MHRIAKSLGFVIWRRLALSHAALVRAGGEKLISTAGSCLACRGVLRWFCGRKTVVACASGFQPRRSIYIDAYVSVASGALQARASNGALLRGR